MLKARAQRSLLARSRFGSTPPNNSVARAPAAISVHRMKQNECSVVYVPAAISVHGTLVVVQRSLLARSSFGSTPPKNSVARAPAAISVHDTLDVKSTSAA